MTQAADQHGKEASQHSRNEGHVTSHGLAHWQIACSTVPVRQHLPCGISGMQSTGLCLESPWPVRDRWLDYWPGRPYSLEVRFPRSLLDNNGIACNISSGVNKAKTALPPLNEDVLPEGHVLYRCGSAANVLAGSTFLRRR